MKSIPEIINISSDSSSDESLDSTPLPPYVPLFCPPHDGCKTKEQARKRKHDLHVFKDLLNLSQTPSTSRGKSVMTPKSYDEEETEELAKKQDIGMSSKAPMSVALSESLEDPNPWIPIQPPLRELISPFLCTSSDEDELQSNPPSTPERPQASRPRPPTRTRRSNPPLPKLREVVIGLPCPRC